MSRLPKLMLTVGMVSILASQGQALAQGPLAGPGQWIGLNQTRLLVDPAVHEELKLDPAQVEKANTLAAEIRESFKAIQPKVRVLPGDQAQAKMAELATPILDDAMATAKSSLKPEQIKRFHQIDIQSFGLIAFTYPVITKKVGITEEQGPKIRAVVVEYQTELRKVMQAANNDRVASKPMFLALRKEGLAKVVALLTDDQKKTWNDLIGEPFDEGKLAPPTPPAR